MNALVSRLRQWWPKADQEPTVDELPVLIAPPAALSAPPAVMEGFAIAVAMVQTPITPACSKFLRTP